MSFTFGYLRADLPVRGYSMRVWQTDDGLPDNTVTAVVQTHDGYLWIGTYGGLARFDGEQFKIFDSANTPELRDRRIACLFEDAQGTLWIGDEAGLITRYRQGRFEPFTSSSKPTGGAILGLGSDAQGRLWAMRQDGAVDSLGDGKRLPSLIAPDHPGVMAWTRGGRGGIWLAENGRAARLENGTLAPLSLGPPRRVNYVLEVAAAADGGVWILCDDRIRKWRDGRWTEDRGDFPWAPGPVSSCLELRDGTLAVGTIYSGLYLVFRDGRSPVHFDRTNGLPQNWVRFLAEDREGDLWIGDGGAGLVSIHASPFSVLDSPDQWQGCTVLSVAPGRTGALWIGTDGAGLYHYAAGAWTHYGTPEGLRNWYISAVADTPAVGVWAGYLWWGGPYRLNGGLFARPGAVDATWGPVLALLAGPGAGELLVGNRDGLVQIAGDRSRWLLKSPDQSAGGVCALARDPRGPIWCGFEEGGLARLADGRVSRFGRKDGLGSEAVQCLSLGDDGSLWIGTAGGGLARFRNGHFANLGTAQGLADNDVCAILDDGLGCLWLSTRHGIQRAAKEDLNRCADGLIPAFSGQIYDRGDGLPTSEFTGGLQGTACRTPDGRLWFASSKGLVSVDPTRIERNRVPPPVVFESLLVDGKPVPIGGGSAPLPLPPDHRRLEFQFTALSYVSPNKVLFKYRLDGIDKAWVEAGAKRSAFYSRLPAGTYRFHVIACNNDGLWNEEGASLGLTVAPFFWETWWFLGACALLVLSAVSLLVRYATRRRMQRKMDRLERQSALERERARIAQDIHDDIGVSLTRIGMFSQPDRAELAEPQRAAAVLSRIYATTREATRALDEIVWAVDPRHDTLESLAGYMGRFAQDLFSAANIRCRLDLPAELPAWPLTAETRHNLFLAFEEALNNVVKHAEATEAHVSLQLHSDRFVLTVRDNGKGFDPARRGPADPGRSASGNGLLNLERRLVRIGGRCEISTRPGGGTQVSFVVGVPIRSGIPPLQGSGTGLSSPPPSDS